MLNDDVHVRLATSVDGGDTFVRANLSEFTSNETEGFPADYLEYIGFAVYGGTAHALWASRMPERAGTPDEFDLEALYASALVHGAQGQTTLTVIGDDGNSATNDVINVTLFEDNEDFLVVEVNGNIQFAGLAAGVDEIEIYGVAGTDTIQIHADIDADFEIHGGDGGDGVTLVGKNASALGKFEFFGDGGNDTFTIDFRMGDPLPRAGFDFDFNGGDGEDNASVIEVGGGDPLKAWFVNMSADAADLTATGARPDSSSQPDDQITLRAAIQEANRAAATAKTYVFLPTGTYSMSVPGTGADAQGDFDITKNVTIIGTGAGEAIIDASGLVTVTDRIFDVLGGGTLNLSRVTLTGGTTRDATNEQHGGAIQVRAEGMLHLNESALVGNQTVTTGDGGAIYFWPDGGGTITDSVITDNEASDATGGIFLASNPPGDDDVTLTGTIVALNRDGNTAFGTDVHASGTRVFTNSSNNLLGNETGGVTTSSNHVGSVDYIVTGVADTYDRSNDTLVRSVRDAIDAANGAAGKIGWLAAWDFVLTRERTTDPEATETEVSDGDIEIKKSMTIRGVNGSTSVAWRAGAALDLAFELLGDYNFDLSVDAADRTIWAVQNGMEGSNLAADGDDNAMVDGDDLTLRNAHFGNELTISGVSQP
jgi:hypothetical protein